MSVNVIVYGAEQTSDEYVAALKLKQIIQDSLPNSAIGEIVLFASATLVGQAVKDVDLLMIGEVQNYSVNAEFQTEAEGFVKDRVAISSFCTTIEIKRHDISSIFVNGTDFYVKYGTRNHCVTSQSNKQKIATMKFFEKTLMVSPYITNIIWFTQATPGDIKKLLTNNGRTMPSNVLGSDFDFKELMQLLIWQQPPHKRWNAYTFDSSYNAGSLQAIQNALSLFSKTKAHMGEMTRRRIEQLTNKAFQTNALIDPQGKVSIYRGRAGTGKTVGLIQTAIHLVDEGQARVLMLTYNKALVSDIRRLFALAELPDMFEANCLHINTMHSYFFQLSNAVLFNGKLNGSKFLEKYESILKELLTFMSDDDAVEMVKEVCFSDSSLDWDYVLIDEAQDWSNLERDIVLKLFDKGIRKLRKQQLKAKGRSFVIGTFTATAIYHGLEDMYTETINSLHMLSPITYLGYVKRGDIDIVINHPQKPKGIRAEYELDKFEQIETILHRALITDKKTLIYFPTVALIERCYEYFKSKHKVEHIAVYHGSLSKDAKQENYEKFLAKDKLVMFATKAFGMGIDINDIELVVHFAPTGNVCDYVQEIGRAARREDLRGEALYYYNSWSSTL